MSNFNVPKGYRERERRGIERAKRRAGGVSDEIRAQRHALIAEIDAREAEVESVVETVEPVVAPVEPVAETDAPAETEDKTEDAADGAEVEEKTEADPAPVARASRAKKTKA